MATVVVSHVAYSNGLSDWAWFAWHVPGFLIISGFFGIRFNWMKVIRLLGVCYGCYWLTIPFRAWPPSLISLLLPHGAWFLPFYLVLMIFSPILDAAMVDRTRHRKIFVACLILLVWGWVSTLTNNAHLGMLQVPGLNGNGLLLMMAIYLFGRLLYEHPNPRVEKIMGFLFAPMVFLIWVVSHFFGIGAAYVAPHVIFTSFCGFCLFKRLVVCMPDLIARIVLFVSPSMFGVYVLHACCFPHLWKIPDGGMVLLRSVFLFCVSLLIDLIRRGIVWFFRGRVNPFFSRLFLVYYTQNEK